LLLSSDSHPVTPTRHRPATSEVAGHRRGTPADARFPEGAQFSRRTSSIAGHRANERRMKYPPGFCFLEARRARGVRSVARLLAAVVRPVDAKCRADCLLVANKRTRNALPSSVRGRVIELVENGVIPELWLPDDSGRLPQPDLPNCPFELIFVGRLERWKGVDWLIEAMARVYPSVDCRLKIVGEFKDERQRLAGGVSQLGIESRVESLGWQPQARCAQLLSEADVLVLPSVFECGGAVVLEAMVVAARIVVA